MSLDLKQAFTYLKDDSQGLKKMLIGTLLMIFPTILNYLTNHIRPNKFISLGFILVMLLVLLISLIVSIYVMGYFTAAIRDRSLGMNLPEWKEPGSFFVLGFKYLIGYILFSVPFSIVIVMLSVNLAAAFQFNMVLAVLSIIAMLVVHITMLIFASAMLINFSKDFKILSMVNFPKALKIIKGNVKEYAILVLLTIVLAVGYGVVWGFLSWTKIGLILVPTLSFWMLLVLADLLGQYSEKSVNTAAVEISADTENNDGTV